MDQIYTCLLLYRQNRLNECVEECSNLLRNDPSCKAAWLLKAKCLAEKNSVDEVELDLTTVVDSELGHDEILADSKPKTN